METTVETHELKNSLKLQVIDDSRPIAGDRFQVVAILRMQVPVKTSCADARVLEQVDLDSLYRMVGDSVVFEIKMPEKGHEAATFSGKLGIGGANGKHTTSIPEYAIL